MKPIRISDAEQEIMEIIWDVDQEITSADIIEKLGEENPWKHTTILTLAKRLINKGVLKVRKEKGINYYSPKISKGEYKSHQANGFIEDMYDGSIKSLVASLYDNKRIDERDLRELKDWIRGL
ncbi:MAG: BlaI/MecI/CopY family transcriptional regulator [Bacillota bacterium]